MPQELTSLVGVTPECECNDAFPQYNLFRLGTCKNYQVKVPTALFQVSHHALNNNVELKEVLDEPQTGHSLALDSSPKPAQVMEYWEKKKKKKNTQSVRHGLSPERWDKLSEVAFICDCQIFLGQEEGKESAICIMDPLFNKLQVATANLPRFNRVGKEELRELVAQVMMRAQELMTMVWDESAATPAMKADESEY